MKKCDICGEEMEEKIFPTHMQWKHSKHKTTKYLYYSFGDELIKIRYNKTSFLDINNFDVVKLTRFLKNSLTKKFKISIGDYIKQEYGIDIKKCGFCDYYSDFDMIFDFKEYKNSYIIIIKDIIYDKLYCRGKNENCKGKHLNPNSKEFIMGVYNVNEKESLEIIHKRNKSPFYIENHDNQEEYRRYQSVRDRLNDEEYKKFIKYSKTIEYYIEKYGLKDGTMIWNEINKKKDSTSFNFFLKKNNFNYKKSIIEFKERIKSVSCKATSYIGGNYSKESYDFFKDLIIKLELNDDDIIFGNNEFFIEYFDSQLNKKRRFFYDFIDIKNNLIIEYNGIRWHPNKNKMSKEQYEKWYFPFDKEIKASTLEEKDILKENIAIKNNYKYIVLWDCDGKDNNTNIVCEYYKLNKLI